MNAIAAATKTKIHIVLVCEYQIVCLGLAQYISTHNELDVIGHALSLEQLSAVILKKRVDVALVELALLKRSGLSAIRDIHKIDAGIKVLVISRDEKEPFVSKCVENGALGYVSLKCEPQELIQAIHTVNNNQKFLSKDVAYDFAMSSLSKESEILSTLTCREYQVFTLLAQGISVNDIAVQLYLSPKTIHVYRAAIMAKLSAKTASELTVIALKNGVITIDVIS